MFVQKAHPMTTLQSLGLLIALGILGYAVGQVLDRLRNIEQAIKRMERE